MYLVQIIFAIVVMVWSLGTTACTLVVVRREIVARITLSEFPFVLNLSSV